VVYRNRSFSAREDDVVQPDGQPGLWYYLEMQPVVVIIARDHHGAVAMVEQWRYVQRFRSLEVPSGMIELTDTDVRTAAKRELAEETGLTARRWQLVGSYFEANSTRLRHCWLAEELTVGKPKLDRTEDITLHWLPWQEALDAIHAGRIIHGTSIMALLRTDQYLRERKNQTLKTYPHTSSPNKLADNLLDETDERHNALHHSSKGVRVYFAAAMRGGRDNLKTNQQIVAHLAQLGHEVLTPYVTQDNFANAEAELTNRHIDQRDMALLSQADVVVAETTTPSLGTGYEIAAALQRGISVLCLHRADTPQPFSALIAGISHSKFTLASYMENGWRQAIEKFLSGKSRHIKHKI